MMLDEVLYLNEEDAAGPQDFSHERPLALESDPPIMIPGIAEDGSLFPVEKIEAHLKGIHHLALSVFVFDEADRLLIQKRADAKYHCGGMWANTCCTHPHMNEDMETAAQRRLQEELGFTLPVTHKRIVEYSANVGNGLWERERVHMFCAYASSKTLNIELNPDEVSQTRWISASDLADAIAKTPDKFSPWFRIYAQRFPDLNF